MSVSPGFKTAIDNHLQATASKDLLFAETLKKPNKNIDECCTYIINEVQRLNRSKAVAMADDEVFKMARHYYDEDDIKVGKPTAAAANHSTEKAIQPALKIKVKKVIENQPSLF